MTNDVSTSGCNIKHLFEIKSNQIDLHARGGQFIYPFAGNASILRPCVVNTLTLCFDCSSQDIVKEDVECSFVKV